MMNLAAVIVGLLLAFLLFTPPGQSILGGAIGAAMDASHRPDPAKLAAWEACEKAWNARPHGYYDHLARCD